LEVCRAHHEQVVSFVTRQLLDAVSPANFIATNPEALETTIREAGQNLVHGAMNFFADWERAAGGKPPLGAEAFQPGRTVAVSKGQVVYCDRLIETIVPGRNVNAVGYCLGGTLLSIAAAFLGDAPNCPLAGGRRRSIGCPGPSKPIGTIRCRVWPVGNASWTRPAQRWSARGMGEPAGLPRRLINFPHLRRSRRRSQIAMQPMALKTLRCAISGNRLAAAAKGLAPRDQIEAMLGAQMAAVHNATTTFARRLAHVYNIQQQDSA